MFCENLRGQQGLLQQKVSVKNIIETATNLQKSSPALCTLHVHSGESRCLGRNRCSPRPGCGMSGPCSSVASPHLPYTVELRQV